MNIEAYNLDSLRKLVRALQAENKELRELLEKAEIPYANSEVFADTPGRKEEFDLDQGGRITQQFIDKKLAVRFFSMFWGREDVFAKRAKNGNYYPQCDNRWNNALCPKQKGENLLESTDLISQWEDELNKFLSINEELPEYKTKTGRVKKRESVIGTLKGGRDTLTGIVDIAMIGSLYKKGKFHERLNDYGMIIMDECHHGASATAQEILKKVNAKYVYGVSATPMRSDNLEKINYMLLGPIRHQYTALERNEAQGIDHLVIPRYTRVANTAANKDDINEAYALVSGSKLRNEQIIEDIKECVEKGRTPVILTKYKEHAKYIYDYVQGVADFTFILYGDNSGKENESIRRQMKEIPRDKSFILVATGQKIGEGFDCPRLDTLMLAAPVSFAGRLEQYVGRVNRDCEGKKDVVVYDYIDSHISKFENMYLKRLRTYKKIGFKVVSDAVENKQDVNAIYDSGNYMEIFERDLIEAEKEISEEEIEHFAVLDHSLVWHGGMNLLGKEDAWDNLIRVRDEKAAAELLAMMFAG